MKISGITLETVKMYLRVDDDTEDILIESFISAAKDYIVNYTGRTLDELEAYEDISLAILAIVGEMYDNRTVGINDKLNIRVNELIPNLLSRHAFNLL